MTEKRARQVKTEKRKKWVLFFFALLFSFFFFNEMYDRVFLIRVRAARECVMERPNARNLRKMQTKHISVMARAVGSFLYILIR